MTRDPIAQEDYFCTQAALPLVRSTNAVSLAKAEDALASVNQLETFYIRDRNPVYVWDAIMQIHWASPILGRPFVFPPWVLAYLFSAATMIAGAAVTTPKGDRKQPVAPVKNRDGKGSTYYSSWFAGLTAKQRRDMALEALGFKGSRGDNPLAQAHRNHEAFLRLREEKFMTEKGLTKKAAAEKASPHVNDPARKMRRDRRRLGGET